MVSDAEFERVLLFSALTPRSIEARRPQFERWRRWLATLGVDELPRNLHTQVPEEARARNLVTLLILQASPLHEAAKCHRLRNLTGIRPEKP